jgi:hypothetical protein
MRQQQASPWLWFSIGGAIFLYLSWTLIPVIYCHYNGKETMAVIKGYSKTTEGGVGMDSGRTVWHVTYQYDGHRAQKRTSARNQEIGAQKAIIYLPENPQCVVRGSRATGLWNTIEHSTNERNVAIALIIGMFFVFCGFKQKQYDKRSL